MDFITSSILGGLLYDSAKFGFQNSIELVRSSLKKFILTDDEVQQLALAIENDGLNKESSKKEFEKAIDKIDNIEELLKTITKNSKVNQNIKIDTLNGANVGVNDGTINLTFN